MPNAMCHAICGVTLATKIIRRTRRLSKTRVRRRLMSGRYGQNGGVGTRNGGKQPFAFLGLIAFCRRRNANKGGQGFATSVPSDARKEERKGLHVIQCANLKVIVGWYGVFAAFAIFEKSRATSLTSDGRWAL